jgi:histidyl-tRNA synthetase
MINRVRGTQDCLDLKLRNFILDLAKKHLECHNFSEIETPILEYTKLFARSLGEHTDVVSKEMYVFGSEEGEDSICLRPEGTASIIRAFIENNIEKRPWKVFIFGPMFRRERPQKGRWRQFDQLSMEIINSESIAQDANFIKILDSFVSDKLGLQDYILKLNFLGCFNDRKEHKKALGEFLEAKKSEICETCQVRKDKNILRIFDCKNETCKKIYLNAPKLTDHLCQECDKEWRELQEILQILSVSFVHDYTLVRGLDYYNKTVFEFSSKDLGAQEAFCGGGRYSLGKEMDASQDYPSIGAAFGMGRLLMLIEKNLDKIQLPQERALHVILPMSAKQHALALLMSDDLHANGLCTDILLEEASMTNMMKKANKLGAKYVLILGENEQQSHTVSVKNMQTGQSEIIKQSEAAKYLKKQN